MVGSDHGANRRWLRGQSEADALLMRAKLHYAIVNQRGHPQVNGPEPKAAKEVIAMSATPMSANRKVLKVISIISLVLDIILIAFGAVLLAAVATNPNGAIEAAVKSPVANFTGEETVSLILGASVFVILVGLWDAFVSFMGIRGANDPSKMGFVTVMAGISVVLTAVGVLASIFNGQFEFSELFSLAFTQVFFYVCYQIREEGKKQG